MSSYDDEFPVGWTVFGVFAFIMITGGIVIGVRACDTAQRAAFDPVNQEIDRRTFENTQAYREGIRRDCDELMLQYAKAKSDDERTVILSTLRHRVEGAPPAAVPDDVKQFLSTHSK